ncbi:MAG: choline ABC transporter permease subunit [Propylenella sp.]
MEWLTSLRAAATQWADAGVSWLEEHKVPIGRLGKSGVDWLRDNATPIFDAIEAVIDSMVGAVLVALTFPHPFVMVAILTVAAYFARRSFVFAALVAVALLFIINLGFWEETTETLALVISSAIVCMAVGVPIGIAAAHRPRLYSALRPVLDLMQTLPTFVYLIPVIIFFGIGMVPGLIATVVFVVPAPIRATHLGIVSTPKHLIEAGEAFGATRRQLLWKVEIPYAAPQIMAGLTQTIMLSLSMVVIAGLVGADGLGVAVVRALNTVNLPMGIEAGLVIVLVAIILDRLLRAGEKA